MSTEIFNTATWNFLTGDRSVEDILKDKSISKITVRGGAGTVLPTVAGIKDLEILDWKDPVTASIHVPSNALSLHRPSPDKAIREDKFYETLLNQSFGVNIWNSYQYYPEQLLIIMNMTEGNETAGKVVPVVLNILRQIKDEKVIFTCPRKQKLLPEFRPFAMKAWSAIYWDGLNGFFSSTLEEAVREAHPQKILVTGAAEEHLFYTAIGAIDYFIIEDSLFRDPSSLKLWDIMETGKKVSLLSCSENGKGELKSIENLITAHLEEILKVDSTMTDYEYSKVADHKIMIDVS